MSRPCPSMIKVKKTIYKIFSDKIGSQLGYPGSRLGYPLSHVDYPGAKGNPIVIIGPPSWLPCDTFNRKMHDNRP